MGMTYTSTTHHSDKNRTVKAWIVRQCDKCGRFLGKHHTRNVCHNCSIKHQRDVSREWSKKHYEKIRGDQR